MRMLSLALSLLVSSSATFATDWTQFRGPNHNGTSDETGIPLTWSKTENIAWKTPLPGPGSGASVVFGDKIFLPSFNKATKDVEAYCLDKKTGKILWQKVLGPGQQARDMGRENFFSEGSPCVDAKRVYFITGSGHLVAFDHDGKELWHRDLIKEYGPIQMNWGYACSPLLFQDKLYVNVLRRNDDSYLMAVNLETGQNIFKVARATPAQGESPEAYTTPLPFKHGEKWEVLVFGGDTISGHEPDTGKETWRWGGLNPTLAKNYRCVAGPVACGKFVLINAPQYNPLFAIDTSLEKPAPAWTNAENVTDTPVPAIWGDKAFVFGGRKPTLSLFDVPTGKIIFSEKLADITGLTRSSPLIVDNKVYVISASGEVRIYKLADTFEQIGKIDMGEYPCRAPLVPMAGHLLVRTGENIYCVGPKF